ncbi:hypothetical protein BGW38_002364 [Lunasporangiospora selenospora]|uniref:Exportin-1/Importin-beta-like domain-containing protein n=1 Tax=Lunasporangiospora selenospora TaxID=979761 RepID=A0A9P6FS63_9FUNG|nr:hypothetical protein BGW38_002364 [Lunasporangiospora selenospora]
MRNELTRWVVRYSGGPAFVRTKLCLALAAYAMRAVPTYWPDFIASFYQDLRSRVNLPVDGVLMAQPAMELALLEFLTIVPEELGRVEIEPARKTKLSDEVTRGLPVIINIVQEILLGNNATSKPKALDCLKSWVQYGITFDVIQPILGLVLNCLLDDGTFDAAADVWSEIMASKSAARHQDTICEGLMPCFATESEDIGRRLCQLLSTFGDNFSDWIAGKLLRADIVIYLEMMLSFAGFPGHYAEDETVSDLTLNFWYMLQESLSELPTDDGEDSSSPGDDSEDHQVTLSTISSAANTIGLDRNSLQAIKGSSLMMYTRLTEVLRKKLEFPPHHEWIKWTRDIRQEFIGHRQEIADTLINSYHVLHGQIVSLIIDACSIQLDRVHEASLLGTNPLENVQLETALVQLESSLYCMKALSEVVPNSESEQMPRFFGASIFGRLPVSIDCRARETAMTMIGKYNDSAKNLHSAALFSRCLYFVLTISSYADWFKQHPQFLLPALNFVIPALEAPQVAPYAAKALKSICDTCRESLVETIDAFMNVFANVEKSISPTIKGSVVYSIATVIQTLPMERSIAPLVGLLGDIFTHAKGCMEAQKLRLQQSSGGNTIAITPGSGGADESGHEPQTAMMLLRLDFLLACCKGLQSPLEDEYRTAEERVQLYRRLVLERTSVMAMGGLAVELARSMEQVIQGAVLFWPSEPDIIERVCQILKNMMSATHFSPLSLSLHSLIKVVETGYQRHAYPCWLDVAAKIASVYYFEATGGSLAIKLGSGTVSMGAGVAPASASPTPNQSAIVVDVEARAPDRAAQQQSPDELENEEVFKHMLAVLIRRTMEGMRSLADMEENPDVDFVNQSYDYPGLKQRVDDLIARMGPQIMRHLLLGLGGHVPRSLVPQLNDTLYPLIGKYTQESRRWMQSMLSESGFPSKHADQLSKEKFMKGVLQTRSPKKFKDEVHQFSNKCRQLDGSLFGAAI